MANPAPTTIPLTNAAVDLVRDKLPPVFRVQNLLTMPTSTPGVHSFRATLFHEKAELAVGWAGQPDPRVRKNALVRIRHARYARSDNGVLKIDRLLVADIPDSSVNLFMTVPRSWVADRNLVAEAIALYDAIPEPLASLFTQLMWDSSRFHRFAYGPSSLDHHHSYVNGNLRHSVEVAQMAGEMARRNPKASVPLAMLGGLIHDAGKVDEYRFDRERQAYVMSERGALVGHRDTLIELVALARKACRQGVPECLYLALLHMLNSAEGAPTYLGLRAVRSPEAAILHKADSLSVTSDLMTRAAPRDGQGGFGFRPARGKYPVFILPAGLLPADAANEEVGEVESVADSRPASAGDTAAGNRKSGEVQETITVEGGTAASVDSHSHVPASFGSTGAMVSAPCPPAANDPGYDPGLDF